MWKDEAMGAEPNFPGSVLSPHLLSHLAADSSDAATYNDEPSKVVFKNSRTFGHS